MIKITTVTRLPYEADEEPGMPSFDVTGTTGTTEFNVITSLEIDGRDGEHTVKSGPADLANTVSDNGDEYFEALCEHPDFIREFQTAADEYYSS